ncbi:MAG: Spx/MgsR family RNA polymerase-binding regulatory protein [Kangiellaceae bacterium]|nr:Spx/MgsR family RNA polymerase-binding regulatory protein [Kangiellaceae bacterium]
MSKKVKLYGIKNCDTVRKSIKWLADKQIDSEFFDLKKEELSTEQIIEWLNDVEQDKLINRRGLTWRKIPTEDKLLDNQSAVIALIQNNPTVIKRPIVHNGIHWSVGFKPEDWDQLFL